MKKIFAMSILIMILLCGCGVDDVEDQMINVVQQNEEHVWAVKNGSPEIYPNYTYEEAFGDFFGSPTWKYFLGTSEGPDEDGDGKPDYIEDNLDVVEFTGTCMYQDVEVKALIQFKLDVEGGTFDAVYLSFNDVPQNTFMLNTLIEKAFAEYDDKQNFHVSNNTENVTENKEETTSEKVDNNLDKFIGKEGVYICESPVYEGETGKIEIYQMLEDSFEFSVDTLEMEYDLMHGVATITGKDSALYDNGDYQIYFTWDSGDSLYTNTSGEYDSRDAGTIEIILHDQGYIRPDEFN